jgi:hypothetical protein
MTSSLDDVLMPEMEVCGKINHSSSLSISNTPQMEILIS